MSKKADKIMKNYSIFAPIIKRNVKREEAIRGIKFTKEERNEFIKNDTKKFRTRAAIAAGILGLGISIGTVATNALPAPKESNVKVEQQNNKTNAENFRENLKAEVEPINIEEKQNEENVMENILAEYNKQYNEELTVNDVGFIKTNPTFVYVDGEDYIYDYKEKTEAPEYTEDVGDIYVIVDNNDEIISSIGKVDGKYANIDTKQVKIATKEYVKSEKTLDVTKNEDGSIKSKDEIEKLFVGIEKAYEEKANEPEIAD